MAAPARGGWAFLFFSPKGWDNLAQGNALGRGRDRMQPEGLRQEKMSQAFSLENTNGATQG